MLSYEWDEGEPLSARGDDSTCLLTERRNHTLLRPIYINAVEVGYANYRYTQCDKDKRLNVRGVTIALCPASNGYRSHETRLMSGDSSDKHQDDFLPEYLRPPKDSLDDEPRFTEQNSLPNYLGNPNSIYRLRSHKSGSFGSTETSTTNSSSSSHHYNGYFKNSATSPRSPPPEADTSAKTEKADGKIRNGESGSPPKEQPLDQLSPTYSTEYVGYSTASDWPPEALLTNEEKCAIKLSQIFGWRKKHPRVRVVSRLVDFALVEPDEEDDDKPGEDVINYTDLLNLLKTPEPPASSTAEAEATQGNLIDFSDDILISTSPTPTPSTATDFSTTIINPQLQPLSLLDL
ncbi:unnamed protein product [Nippostrongylus brasiliensis]|uniref:SH2 domain-containing protein n=1 Tax=Nippostrongylus brasiliensis TaxID=27835 RepID=A0A158R2H2_NIPBR|nr:unnamed protein product [Nippostrongylus brasiliensis]